MTGSVAADDTQSLADRAYVEIRDRLIMLEIRPGAPINDDRLASALSVGRTPVREALKRLEAERLVVAYPRRGTFATEVNITDLGHIFEVRQHLEPVAASGAAQRATPRDRRGLEALAAQLARPTRVARSAGPARPVRPVRPMAPGPAAGELMRTDMRVHRAIYTATHNPFLEDTLIRYDNLATRIWCLFADRLPGLAGHVDEHAHLLRAVIDGDGDKAAALAGEHVAHFEQAIRAVI
jgi:DNA-binding GntR family transcriptional regulator